MSFTLCVGVLGALLLLLATASAYLRWLPVTTSAVCLLFGLGIGPAGLGLVSLELTTAAPWLEHLTEAAVLLSLFGTGIKLRLSLRRSTWRTAYRLAGPVMVASIAALALAAHAVLGMPWGPALLLAAMLAPTDPVLANIVQVSDAGDDDRLRFGLSGEAGLNDGAAFPFVLLGLLLITHHHPGPWLWTWLLSDVAWAIPVGLASGYALGRAVGHWMIFLRVRNDDSTLTPHDFLALALVALAYVLAEQLHAYGFLAVFAAGVGLRQAEARVSGSAVPAEHLAQPVLGHHEKPADQATVADLNSLEKPQLAAGIMMGDMLALGSLAERSMEVVLITLLGTLLWQHWNWPAAGLALLLFVVIRPAAVWLLAGRARLNGAQRVLLGWFGIRGIGTLYYLCVVLNEPLPAELKATLAPMALTVVGLSILLHGCTVQPLLEHYGRRNNG